MVAAVAAVTGSHTPAGLAGEGLERLRRDARAEPVERTLGPLCVGASLVADLRPSSRSVRRVLSIADEQADLAISTRMTRCCLTAAFAIDGRSSPGSGRQRMLMAVEPVTLFCRA